MSWWRRTGLRPVALVLAALVAFGGCGSTYAGSTVAQQVQSWTRTSPDPKFAQAVSTLQGDFRRVAAAQATDATDLGTLRTVCDVLVTDALGANQNLPTPDGDLTDVLSHAYGSAAGAGEDCFCADGGRPCPRGVSSNPSQRPGLLARSARERVVAERDLIEAEARVDQLTVQTGGPGS